MNWVVAVEPWLINIRAFTAIAVVCCWLGLRFVQKTNPSQRESILAIYDLAWIVYAFVAVFYAFTSMGSEIWSIEEKTASVRTENALHGLHRRDLPSLGERYCGKLNVSDAFGRERQSYAAYKTIQRCNFAREQDLSISKLKESFQAAQLRCDKNLFDEFNLKLFSQKERASTQYDACDATSTLFGECGRAFCNWQSNTYQVRRLLIEQEEILGAHNISPEFQKIKNELSVSPSLNHEAFQRLHVSSPLFYLFTLPPFCALFGLRLSKAICDVYFRATNTGLSGWKENKLGSILKILASQLKLLRILRR